MASHPVCRCSPPPGEYFPGGREGRERRRERKKHYWDIMAETQRWAAAAWVHPRNQQSRLMAVSGVMAAIKLFSSLLGLPFRCKMIESTAQEPRSILNEPLGASCAVLWERTDTESASSKPRSDINKRLKKHLKTFCTLPRQQKTACVKMSAHFWPGNLFVQSVKTHLSLWSTRSNLTERK